MALHSGLVEARNAPILSPKSLSLRA